MQTQSDAARHQWLCRVFGRFEGPLTAYAARITRDLERARDVVQETFIRLLGEERGTIEPYLAEWLYTVCRNKALDIRRKERRMAALVDVGAGQQEAASPQPAEVVDRAETLARVLRYMTHLSENQQEVIRLKFQHGLSYKEISAITGLSVTNIGFLIHTGLKNLRERLETNQPVPRAKG
jgi:RNA polymerase sigma factor (sigma-70 family)